MNIFHLTLQWLFHSAACKLVSKRVVWVFSKQGFCLNVPKIFFTADALWTTGDPEDPSEINVLESMYFCGMEDVKAKSFLYPTDSQSEYCCFSIFQKKNPWQEPQYFQSSYFQESSLHISLFLFLFIDSFIIVNADLSQWCGPDMCRRQMAYGLG